MNQLSTQTVRTMSSREIAELTGKTVTHVHRDIARMLEQIEHDPNMDHLIERDSRGYIHQYNLPRRECEILVTGYDVVRRAAVIDRWMTLEQQIQQPMIPTTTAAFAHLFNTALQQEQQLVQHTERLESIETSVQAIEARMENRGCDEGFMLRSDAFRRHGRLLSKDMFYRVLDIYEVTAAPITVVSPSGHISNTWQVNEDEVKESIELFYMTLVPVTRTQYVSTIMGERRFKA